MINRKVRRFKVGESLNTIFSARQFGLALAIDIESALKDFPEPILFGDFAYFLDEEVLRWKTKWFLDFIEKDDKNE